MDQPLNEQSNHHFGDMRVSALQPTNTPSRKRRNPFEPSHPRQHKHNHTEIDYNAVYNRTKMLMHAGQMKLRFESLHLQKQKQMDEALSPPVYQLCSFCNRNSALVASSTQPSMCSFCEKPVCAECGDLSICYFCEGAFCRTCSTLNYDLEFVRVTCLSCCQDFE